MGFLGFSDIKAADTYTDAFGVVAPRPCADVVEMLLKSRAGKGSEQLDALLLLTAEHNASGDVIKILIGNGASVRAVDKYLQTPLVIAARHNPSAGVITALVECGADLDGADIAGGAVVDVAEDANDRTTQLSTQQLVTSQ